MRTLEQFELLRWFFGANGIDPIAITTLDEQKWNDFFELAQQWRMKIEEQTDTEEELTEEEVRVRRKKEYEEILYHSAGS
jgi:hypothetical protein